jgi:hypothetical protein
MEDRPTRSKAWAAFGHFQVTEAAQAIRLPAADTALKGRLPVLSDFEYPLKCRLGSFTKRMRCGILPPRQGKWIISRTLAAADVTHTLRSSVKMSE